MIFRRGRRVLLIAGLAVAGAATRGTGVFGKLQSAGGFAQPISRRHVRAGVPRARLGGAAATQAD